MRVLLVTSEGACGIAEHSAYLKQYVEAADPSIEVVLHTDLHPGSVCALPRSIRESIDLIWLNYQASLHSQWTPRDVEMFQQAEDGIRGVHPTPVGITFHDTGVPNSEQCRALHAVADAFVVHEPCADLPGAHYWRQGVPDWPIIPNKDYQYHAPCLGSMGFPFPWKNFDLLAEATAIAGWDLKLLAPRATPEQIATWKRFNPRTFVRADFVDRVEAGRQLARCDATAFVYNCHNTGTSGAIRQGIAARKPVIASRFDDRCTAGRQFRDLTTDDLARRVITWIEPTLEQTVEALSRVRIAPVDAGMVRLAERDSWAHVGEKYAALYKELVNA